VTKRNGLVAVALVILLAIAANTYIGLRDHKSLTSFVRAESEQRVQTIGERCETTAHQATVLHHNLPPARQGEAAWFDRSYARCLGSLAKVEARAHVTYKP
jgi:hypothetical protein